MGTQVSAKMYTHLDARKGICETIDYIKQLASEEFYGTLELRFEAGNIVHLNEHRSLKTHSLKTSDKLRSAYEKEE